MKKTEKEKNILYTIIEELTEKMQDAKFTFGERCAIKECIESIEKHLKESND
mgnify:FL=1